METLLLRNAQACGRPHVRDVNVLLPIAVGVQPARAHSRAYIFDSRLSRDGSKRSVAVIAIQIASPEVVGDVKIGPAIAVVIAPGTCKAVTIVINVQSRSFGAVRKVPRSVV